VSARRPDPPDALLLDEMFSPTIAELLAKRGVDCQAVVARAVLRSRDDAEVFEAAVREARILVTNNVVDFEILRRRAAADGRDAPGLIYTSDNRFPRRRAFVAQLADALEHAARSHQVEAEGGVLSLRPPDG
jgi:hypothetical protein